MKFNLEVNEKELATLSTCVLFARDTLSAAGLPLGDAAKKAAQEQLNIMNTVFDKLVDIGKRMPLDLINSVRLPPLGR